jgi:DHA2 family multidrug resistance protein
LATIEQHGEGGGQRILATFGLMLATLTNTLDMTIANIALPHIQGSVSASQDQMNWILTSYIVATAIMTPFSGWLSLRIGRKRLFLISTLLFMSASMLCGMAVSLTQIVAFRVIQGLAGASMMPMSQAALLDLWPSRYTAHVMAVWSAVVTAAPVIGPTLGGYLTDTLSWRWAFYINVPLDLIGFAAVYLALPDDAGGRQRRFDHIGFLGLVMFTVGMQLMVDRGTTNDWFDARETWIEATVGACGLYLFVVQMLTHRQPFFAPAIFRDRNFVSCNILSLLLAMGLFTSSALIPVMMQQLLGYSAIQAGMAIMPRGFGSVLGFVIVPWLTPILGPRRTILLGMTINAVALWQMGHFDLSMTAGPIKTTGFLQGFGSSLIFNPMSVISYATLPAASRNEAAVLSNMVRSVGGSFGIAIYSVIQLRQAAVVREHMVAHLEPDSPLLNWWLPDVLTGSLGNLAALNGEVNRQAAMIGYNTAFGYMCLSSIAMIPLVLLMRPGRGGADGLPRQAEAH